jgi:ankyrin repeat protein
MLSTKTSLFKIFLVFSLLLSGGRSFCQVEMIIDTSDYMPEVLKGSLENNLMIAASKGYVAEIERLLEKGADIDAESLEGATPLIFAVANNQISSVLTLLDYNPEVNTLTFNNETALIISVRNRNSEITEALIRGGADIDMADKNGATPLHYATLDGSFDMADLLLYYDADCNKKADDGTTPLMAAILAGFTEIADLLIQNGANLEARDKDGFTPLLIAAQNGDTLIMSLLLRDGVNLYEKNNYNYNALSIAIESNKKTAVEFLLEKGDKWVTPENEAVNPYRLASSLGRKDIVEILEKNNIKGNQGLRIDEICLSASVKFNLRDYFTGLAISFNEPLLNAGFIAGCDLKPVYTRVLVRESENTYYQYYDKSAIVYTGLFKDFTISEYNSTSRLSISTSLSAGYSFGNIFRGTDISPENKFKILPSAGLKYQSKSLTFKADLEYMKTSFYRIGPLWVRFGFAYSYYPGITRSPGKTIKWY